MKKKLQVHSMALQNLQARKLRSGFMVFFVFLMAATFFFSTVLMNNMSLGIENTTARMGADLIVVPDEGTEEIRQALFAGTPCSLYYDRSAVEGVEEIEGIANVSPQLYVATLGASCCDAPVQIIAFDPETDFVVKPWLEELGDPELGTGELIAGHNLVADVGEQVTFFNTEFTVAARLAKTGMGYDDSVFMTFETIYQLRESEVARQNLPTDRMEEVISMLMVDAEPDASHGILQIDIQEAHTGDIKLRAVTADELMSGIAEQVSKLTGYGSLLTGLMVLSTALALISIFVITINERRHEFGVLYTLGANRAQVAGLILWEAMIISLGGGVAGVGLTWSLMALFHRLIGMKLEIPFMDMSLGQTLPVAAACIAIAAATGAAAALCSSFEIAKKEPYRLIRENE